MLNMSLAELLALQENITRDARSYHHKVYTGLRRYCPQLSIYHCVKQAIDLVEELRGRLLVHDHYNLSPESLDFVNSNMLLFEDFINFESKIPLISQFQALRISDIDTVVIWLVEADSMQVSFPDGTTELMQNGLKVLWHPLVNEEQITLTAIFYSGHAPRSITKQLDKQNMRWADTFERALVARWFEHHGVSFEESQALPFGECFDGREVNGFPFTRLDPVPDGYGVYPVNDSSEIGPGILELHRICDEEYGFSFDTLIWLARYLPALCAPISEENTNYTPCVNDDFGALIFWALWNDIPFQLAKEFLLRMRLEFSNFPMPIHSSAGIDTFNGRRQLRTVSLYFHTSRADDSAMFFRQRQLELAAYYRWKARGSPMDDALSDWLYAEATVPMSFSYFYTALGSNTFWRLLDTMNTFQPQSALEALKHVFLKEQDAEDVYICWKSPNWDEFLERLCRLGWHSDTVCRNVRTIVHLSDIHIGKNHSQGNSTLANNLVGLIIQHYTEDIKPLVVITGDIVDYGSQANLDAVAPILLRLQNAGLTVLPVPGNHDYSTALDAHTISPALETLSDFFPIGFLDTWEAIIEWLAEDRGYRKDCITGMNVDSGAVTRFRDWQREHFLTNWSEGHAYHYCESYFKPQQKLHCLLMDSQDLDVNPPWWAMGGVLANTGLFMNDECFRFAQGYMNGDQLHEINELIDILPPEDRPMLCVHNWINYYVPIIPPNAEQQLAVMVLNLFQQYGPDGSDVPNEGPPGNRLRVELFKLLLRTAILPERELEQFTDAVSALYGGYGAFSYDYYRHLYGQTEFQVNRIPNPKVNDYDHDTHEIINEGSLFPGLDRSAMLLAGHRHKWYWEDLQPLLRPKLQRIQSSMFPHIRLQSETNVHELRSFLRGIGFFHANYGSYINNIKEELIEALAKKVKDADLHYDVDAKYQELTDKSLDYYCESGPSNKEESLGWLEIHIDLRTGELSIEKREVGQLTRTTKKKSSKKSGISDGRKT